MLGPDGPIVQPELRWRLEIWNVLMAGTSGHSLSAQVADQARVCHTVVPACPFSQGEGLVVAALGELCSGLSQCQPAWWVWAQGSVPYKYS